MSKEIPHKSKTFPKCTDILLQFFFFFYLIHITTRSMLYILFKQNVHCLVLYNLNVILTYSFVFCLFFSRVFCFSLWIFNEDKWARSDAGRRWWFARFACRRVPGGWSLALSSYSLCLLARSYSCHNKPIRERSKFRLLFTAFKTSAVTWWEGL